MEGDRGGVDATRLAATTGFGIALVLGTLFLAEGLQTWREEGAVSALRAEREAIVTAYAGAIKKWQADIRLALDNDELRMTLAALDGAAQLRGRTELGKLLPDLDDATFYSADLNELVSVELDKFGYAKAEQLSEARENKDAARVQAHSCSNDPTQYCLAFVQSVLNGDQVMALAYIKRKLPKLATIRPDIDSGIGSLDFQMGTRVGSLLVLEHLGSSDNGAQLLDKPSGIEGSVFSVSAIAPSLFKPSLFLTSLEGRSGSASLLLALLLFVVAGGLGFVRWRMPALGKHAPAVGVPLPDAPSEADLARKLAAIKDQGEAAAIEVAELDSASALPAKSEKPMSATGAIDRSIFRTYDIRGVVGTTLNVGTAMLIGQAIGSVVREKGLREVVVARDGRLSGPELAEAMTKGLRNAGCDVIDIGAVPTPVLYFATHHLRTGSGVMVTGSHNPPEYNGFKIMVAGETLAEDAIQDLFARIVEGRLAHGSGGLQSLDVQADYLDRIVGDIQISRPLKVVVDAGNGIAGGIGPQVLQGIGCEVMPLYCEVDGKFPNHHPDPGDPHTLEDLKVAIKQFDADLGIAFDGDGDRLGVVTKSGEIIYPDRLLMLFAQDVLTRNPGASIIYDVKCTGQLSEVIIRAGGAPVMWKTGHSLIKAKMKEEDAALAGEMSGHFFFKERWYGFDDGIYSAARLLDILAERSETPEQVFAELPNSMATPELKIQMAEGAHYEFMERFRERSKFPGARVTTIDGVRADYKDGFGLVRCSNTTPCLVLRFESVNKIGLNRIQDTFRMQLLALDAKLVLPF
ncbi:MAG: phosphomannomutase/phosphoglucomutase [Ahniella sp.]|nr:phosphomannomutase/phosphoglucomutase [Ahniella sp.]